MRKTAGFLAISILVICKTVSGQISPGSVKALGQWLVADTESSVGLKDLQGDSLFYHGLNYSSSLFNGHTALHFKKQGNINIPIDARLLTSTTVFTVYQPLDTTNENILWYVANMGRPSFVLTTKRMADLANVH